MEKLVLYLKTLEKSYIQEEFDVGGEGVGSWKVQTSRCKVSTQRGVMWDRRPVANTAGWGTGKLGEQVRKVLTTQRVFPLFLYYLLSV